MLAGLMLAASCSKDDGTSVVDEVIAPSSEPAVEQPVTQKTYPLTIQAKKETSVSKIGLGTDGLSQTFEDTDKLLLTDETSGDVYAELELKNGAGTTSATFSKDLTESEKTSMTGKTILAVIKGTDYADGIQSSNVNLEDAVRKYCYLKATSDFTYTDGVAIPTLTLADQRAYIAFTVADGQKQVSLKKDGDADYTWYPVKDNKVWLVILGGETYSTRLKKKPLTAAKSNVYSVAETDYVDLGQTVDGKKILWKTTNETSNATSTYSKTDSRYNGQAYYMWSTASSKFGTTGDGPRLPTQNELTALKDMFTTDMWDDTNGGVNFSNAYGSVFFPAAGLNGATNAGSYGLYWSGESYGDKADYLNFRSDAAYVYSNDVYYEFSVRLVRGL